MDIHLELPVIRELTKFTASVSSSSQANVSNDPMKVLYDGQIYSIQSFGGVSRYFNNIISRLPPDFKPYMIIPHRPEAELPTHSNLKVLTYGRLRLEHISWRLHTLGRMLEKKYIDRMTVRERFDVAHPTYYSLLTQREVKEYRCPVVLTVHDMIHDLFPDHTVNAAAEIETKRRAILNAQAVICVSENTKQDLLNLYSIPERKISVIHLASGIDARLANGNEPVPTRPYYLYVGSRSFYKNFDRLLHAFAKAFGFSSDMRLCIVGDRFNPSEQQLVAQLNLTNRLDHFGQVSDAHLAKLYRHSVAFVCPSLYEGFGIPLLEAMGCGTAVIASNSSSIPEVVGDAAALFDPRSVDDLVSALLSLVENETYRESLIKKGDKRSKLFSWDKTLDQTLKVYRSVQN